MKIIKKVIISIFFIATVILFNYTVQAATTDYNIDAINETKYPGVKNQIKKMQSQHPNWTFKVLYTGLNWDDVISGEYVGHGKIPSNLIQNTYNGEWICSICGDKLYDVSKEWYCASKEAIKYMMDPRNSLTEEYVFQFQDLGSASGTKDDITKMTEGTFLNNTECIDAILNAAQRHNISPFHLVARIKQEQGGDGKGKMNGYLYTTEDGKEVVIYNLFNIKVSGNSEEGFNQGAKFAYEQGWTSRAASIEGGAKFLREKYLDKGQSTLYFQKYNVVDKNNLYQHQYMQNIRAANDEGNIVYKGYKNNKMLESHFEFTIPLYENMPTNKCARPLNDVYYGSIASELIKININKNSQGSLYISGNIVIVEWINGLSKVPTTMPKITIESTDGTIVKQLYIKQISGNTYYFDGNITDLDKNKEYQIYAELTNTNNKGTQKRMLINLLDGIIGKDGKVDIISKDNKIRHEYKGDLTNEIKTLKLNKTKEGRYYISGEVVVIEWVNGKSTVPTDIPKVTLISTDGKKQLNTSITPTGTNTYYFDVFIDNIDINKQYKLKLDLTTKYNTSTNKTNIINISKMPKQLGKFNAYNLIIQDNVLTFKDNSYIGNINSELITFNVAKNHEGATYVSGQIVVVEWVNGLSTVPKVAPKMSFKSADGTVNMEVFVTPTGTNTYYFDRFIEGIDTSKEYFFEIESGDEKNVSENRSMNVYFTQTKYNDTIVGQYKNKNIRLLKQRIIFEDVTDTYIGNINSELITFNVAKNHEGATYVSGQIVVVEWVNGKSTVPKVAPKMKFKSTDGTVELEVFVTPTGTNTYYFDRFIEGIDTSKDYYFEIESGDEKNVSEYRKMKVNFSNTKYNRTVVGTYKGLDIILVDQRIIIK